MKFKLFIASDNDSNTQDLSF